LASSTKKREGKATSSLGLLLDLIIGFIIIFTIIIGVAVPSPWASYSRRRKIGIDKRLRVPSGCAFRVFSPPYETTCYSSVDETHERRRHWTDTWR
jgi:hypothetical protein